ncbi:hypothetical protein C9374_013849 [Naegleria lovaniensis]|uniref:Uncharacterized protein n=1 Tax=Naegleria lovaniensis TaxID=51637 RepID=A0AA88KPM6_NAELO|nr:uncharacterized protein C9374_013849 [Naegleria lovaniensis]KAG2389289.1 hypothetical protein C9374_013849 [Naegleria lovaniensis]
MFVIRSLIRWQMAIVLMMIVCISWNVWEVQSTHEDLIDELMGLFQKHQWNRTDSLLSETFRLQVYGFVRNPYIPFSGLYEGKNAWKYYFGNLSQYFNVGQYQLNGFEIVAGKRNSSFVKMDETHLTKYHHIKVSLSDIIYFEFEEKNSSNSSSPITTRTVLTFAQMMADTSSIENILNVDSGKSDGVVFFVIGSACLSLFLGIAFGSSTLLIVAELKRRIHELSVKKRNSQNPHLLSSPSSTRVQ